MSKKRFEDATFREIAKRRSAGERIADLCIEYGVSRSTVSVRFRKLGVSIPCKLGTDAMTRIGVAYDEGSTTCALGKEYGVDHHTIAAYLKRTGRRVRTTEENRALKGDPRINSRLCTYRYEARKKKLPFELTREQFSDLVVRPCYYCAQPPANHQKQWETERFKHQRRYSGIDRIDSTKGYLLDNVVPCCFTCNSAKGALTLDEFCAWLERLARHNTLQKVRMLAKPTQ
jgi:hypothetical protein